jgi:hypothetical protein
MCPDCMTAVPAQAKKCAQCGRDFTSGRLAKKALIVVAVLLIAFVAATTLGNKSQDKMRDDAERNADCVVSADC